MGAEYMPGGVGRSHVEVRFPFKGLNSEELVLVGRQCRD